MRSTRQAGTVAKAHIGVQLPHEAGEVVVFEVLRQQPPAEQVLRVYYEAAKQNRRRVIHRLHQCTDMHRARRAHVVHCACT